MRVFLNYRRSDSAAYAGRLYDRLAGKFGKDNVFMDIDAIMPGEDFERVIEDEIAGCDVLLVMVGQGWVNALDDHGKRRLENPRDFVLLEVAAALNRGVIVIPVLLDGVLMPQEEQLPESLKGMIRRQAVNVSHGRFHHDVDRLITSIERHRAKNSPPAWTPIRKYGPKILAASAIAAALAFVVPEVLDYMDRPRTPSANVTPYQAPKVEPPPSVPPKAAEKVDSVKTAELPPETKPPEVVPAADDLRNSTRVRDGIIFHYQTVGEYRNAVAKNPRDADLRWDFAGALKQAGLDKESLEQFAMAVALPPKVIGKGFLYRDYAKALDQKGDLTAAIDAGRKSLSNWPTNKEPSCVGASEEQLGRLLEKARDYGGAIAMWQDIKDKVGRKSPQFANACQVQIDRIKQTR